MRLELGSQVNKICESEIKFWNKILKYIFNLIWLTKEHNRFRRCCLAKKMQYNNENLNNPTFFNSTPKIIIFFKVFFHWSAKHTGGMPPPPPATVATSASSSPAIVFFFLLLTFGMPRAKWGFSGFKPVMRSSEKIGRLGRATKCCLAANAAEKQQRQCNNGFFRSGIIAAWLAGEVYF